MFNSKPKHSYIDFIEGILIGGSLAAMTTYMLATPKGKQLKAQLLKKVEHFRENFEKKAKPAAKKIKRAVKKAKPAARKIKRVVKKAVKSSSQRTSRH